MGNSCASPKLCLIILQIFLIVFIYIRYSTIAGRMRRLGSTDIHFHSPGKVILILQPEKGLHQLRFYI